MRPPNASHREDGGHATHDQQGRQEQRHPQQCGPLAQQTGQVQADPTADEEDRDQEAVADRRDLAPEARMGAAVPVDQADQRAGQERTENDLQAEVRRQATSPTNSNTAPRTRISAVVSWSRVSTPPSRTE